MPLLVMDPSNKRERRHRDYWAWIWKMQQYTHNEINCNLTLKQQQWLEYNQQFPIRGIADKAGDLSSSTSSSSSQTADFLLEFYATYLQLKEHMLSGKPEKTFKFVPLTPEGYRELRGENLNGFHMFKLRYWSDYRVFQSESATKTHEEFQRYVCHDRVKRLLKSEKHCERIRRAKRRNLHHI